MHENTQCRLVSFKEIASNHAWPTQGVISGMTHVRFMPPTCMKTPNVGSFPLRKLHQIMRDLPRGSFTDGLMSEKGLPTCVKMLNASWKHLVLRKKSSITWAFFWYDSFHKWPPMWKGRVTHQIFVVWMGSKISKILLHFPIRKRGQARWIRTPPYRRFTS